jgi:predicted nucleotide-binding protein
MPDIDKDFDGWIAKVGKCISTIAPDSGLSGKWYGLPGSGLTGYENYSPDISAWQEFENNLRRRLDWLGSHYPQLRDPKAVASKSTYGTDVFIVHGRAEGPKETVARFIEKLELKPVILHEQANKGRTVIEKFEDHSDVGFAIVIMTGDDRGGLKDEPDKQNPRVRQNVMLEFGFFLGALGRKRVCVLYEKDVEIPSDYKGVIFIPMENDWQLSLAKEIKAAGLPIDLNNAI